MTITTPPEPGAELRFRLTLGTILTPDATRFEDHQVDPGDVGTYYGPHPAAERLGEDWHLATVDVDGVELFVPFTLEMLGRRADPDLGDLEVSNG